jgi:hypothetical protein
MLPHYKILLKGSLKQVAYISPYFRVRKCFPVIAIYR